MEKEDKRWYDWFRAFLQELDMLGIPIAVYFKKGDEFKAATGGIFSIILYSIMSCIFVHLMIRVFEQKSIEISESVIDANKIFSNASVYPSEGTKFRIAWGI